MISLLLLQSILHTFSQHAQTTCSSPTPLHISVHNSATDVLAGVCQAPPCWSRISSIFPSLCTSGLSVGHYHILSVLWNQLAFLSFGSLLRLDQASPFFKWLAPSQPLDVNSHVNFKKPALTTLSYEGPTETLHTSLCSFTLWHIRFTLMYFFAYLLILHFPITL